MIRKIFGKIKNTMGLHFYTKPQQYLVNFQVQVENLIPKENTIDVILPFPLENDYQKLIGNYDLTPSSGKLKRENKYQNQYIHWQAKLKASQTVAFKLDFQIKVQPRNISTKKTFLPSKGKDLPNQFLDSDKYLNAKDKKIITLSNELTKGKQDIMSKILALNTYVVKNLKYGNPIEGLYTTADTFKKGLVDCGGFDVLLGALCIAQKIPARIVSGFWAGYSKNDMHAWMEILLPNGQWMPADPSIENLSTSGRTKKFAKLGSIGSDRITLSIGSNISLKVGNKVLHLDILQNPKVLTSRGDKSIETTTKFEASQRK